MKDLVIRGSRLAWEGGIFLACLVLAVAVNAVAIARYHTQWIELLTSWRETAAIALGLYVLLSLPRLVWLGAKILLGKTRKPALP